MPKISVVILTRNRQEEVVDCINSILRSSYKDFEIIVIDNASEDDTGEIIRNKFPQVKLVRSDKNLGGAGGRNLGIKYARGNYILFIDDDAVADSDLIENLLKVMKKTPKIGIVQPKIYDFLERNKLQGIGHDINLKTGRIIGIGVGEEDSGQYDQPREIPMVGCCWLLKKEVIAKIGGYDETLFIPYEDSDFCLRARKAGYKIFYAPKAKVWHRGVKSTFVHPWIQALGITIPERGYRLGRNKIIFMRKHAEPRDLFVFLAILLPFYTVVHSLVILICRRFDILRDYWRGVFSGLFVKLDDGRGPLRGVLDETT